MLTVYITLMTDKETKKTHIKLRVEKMKKKTIK